MLEGRKFKIVVTGGVLTPAMAVIEELQRRNDWEIYYLGRKHAMEGEKSLSAESKIIPSLGVHFIPINPGRFQRRFTRYTIPSLLRVPLGFFQSFLFLMKTRPDVICSFGGYVSVPVVFAGWLLRIPILTHEQTVVFGLSSKINAVFARRIAVSFSKSVDYFPKRKVILTGNPLRQEIFLKQRPSWISNLQLSHYPIIYITGGNQGAQVINKMVAEVLTQLLGKYIIIHQTGEKGYEEISNIRSQMPRGLQDHYFVLPYIGSEEIGWVFNKADLVISRAGANTVCEIAALGKPAIFIPIPWVYQDEQMQNAKLLEEAGIAEILPQNQLNGLTLLRKVEEMFLNLKKYQQNAKNGENLVKLDAAEKITDEIYKIVH